MPHIKNLSARSLQYYVIAKKWTLDLEFFKFEIKFLHQLLDKDVMKEETADVLQLRRCREDLALFEKDHNSLSDLLNEQSNLLELIAEDIIQEETSELAVQQIKLEYMMANLTADFRVIKKEIYALVSSQLYKRKNSLN